MARGTTAGSSALYLVGGVLFVIVIIVGGYVLYVALAAAILIWVMGIDGVTTQVQVATIAGAVGTGLAVTVIIAKLRPGRDLSLPLLLSPVLFELLVFAYLRLQL